MAQPTPKRGRPRIADEARPQNHTMRLPPDVIELVRQVGTARVVEVLREHLA